VEANLVVLIAASCFMTTVTTATHVRSFVTAMINRIIGLIGVFNSSSLPFWNLDGTGTTTTQKHGAAVTYVCGVKHGVISPVEMASAAPGGANH
jgi:hypothetical protein